MAEKDFDRIHSVAEMLQKQGLDGAICAQPPNVLLLGGYWPVTGASIAIFTREGYCIVLAPEDESELARRGWAEVRTYAPSSLERIVPFEETISGALKAALGASGLAGKNIGLELKAVEYPAPYVGLHVFNRMLQEMANAIFQPAATFGIDDAFAQLKAIPTRGELEKIRRACGFASAGFQAAAPELKPGLSEKAVANLFRMQIETAALGRQEGGRETGRSGADVYCMSGVNSAAAYAAFQRSRPAPLSAGAPTLVHCNSYLEGFWTDITRTYVVGDPTEQSIEAIQAVLEAREAALAEIQPGIRASRVDAAARDMLAARGLGANFKHSSGHGVGFAAIDHTALPRLHPASPDRLEPGMVFNLEPGVYIENFGGVRHCEMVLATERGCEILTPFHSSLEELLVAPMQPHAG